MMRTWNLWLLMIVYVRNMVHIQRWYATITPLHLARVLSHDYVTAFYLSGDIYMPSSIILLYGNKKRCEEKSIPFKTKVELCNEIIDKHRIKGEEDYSIDRFMVYGT